MVELRIMDEKMMSLMQLTRACPKPGAEDHFSWLLLLKIRLRHYIDKLRVQMEELRTHFPIR